MKKLILSVAVLAAAVSCSKNEVTEVAATSATPISFSSLTDRVVTKAANDDADDFILFARLSSTYTTQTAEDWYFADVYSATSGTAVSLSNATHYWPTATGETVDFLAIAPAIYDEEGTKDSRFVSPSATATDNIEDFEDYNDGTITFTFQSEDGQTDLTAARVLDQEPKTSDVSLPFKHLLAKIIVNVELYQPEGDYTSPSLTGYTLNNGYPTAETDANTYLQTTFNVHTSRGIYYLNMSGDDKVATTTEEDEDARALDGFGYYTHPTSSAAKDLTSVYSGQDVNIVPQSSEGCVIRLSDMIVLTDGNIEFFTQAEGYMNYTIAEGDIYTNADLEADYFHPGYVYVINLVLDANTFDASVISFSATCAEWINAESLEEGDLETPLDEVYYNGTEPTTVE